MGEDCTAPTGNKSHWSPPREVDVRELLNGIFYVLSEGCRWRSLPHDELLPEVSEAMIYIVMIRLMLRRLAQSETATS